MELEARIPSTDPFFISTKNLVVWLATGFQSMALPILLTVVFLALCVALGKWLRWPLRARLFAALLCPFAALCGLWMLNLTATSNIPPPTAALRVAHLNSLFYNHDIAPKITFVLNSHADVVSLVEANQTLRRALISSNLYPYSAQTRAEPWPNHLPMLLLSRWPITRIQDLTPRQQLYYIQHPTNPFYVLQMHIKSPFSATALTRRNEDLARINPETLPKPLIIMADFNTTPWDPAFRPYRTAQTFQASLLPTFPAALPIVPIDHLLTTGFPTAHITRIRVPNTDHLGIIADFQTLPTSNP